MKRHVRTVPGQWRRWLLVMGCAVACAFTLSEVFAAGSGPDLGKPTGTLSTNAYFPVDRFASVVHSPSSGSPLPVYFFAGPVADQAFAETWPLVKALEQFGNLTGAIAANQTCVTVPADPIAHSPARGPVCPISGFDLTHARMRSHLVSLRFRNLIDAAGNCAPGQISPHDWAIFVRFAHATPRSETRFCDRVNNHTRFSFYHSDSPVLIIGNYAEGNSQIIKLVDYGANLPAVVSDSSPNDPGFTSDPFSGFPFATIQSALVAGQNPSGTSLVQDVNAETNIIAALICKGDGMRPKSVCGRSVIKRILKHVK